MSDHPQAIPPRSLEIRVVTDGAKVSIRGDLFEGSHHMCFSHTRESLPAFLAYTPEEATRVVINAIHNALCQNPLF